MCFEGLARLSRRVWRRFVRGSREISLVPSLHRASTDALIHMSNTFIERVSSSSASRSSSDRLGGGVIWYFIVPFSCPSSLSDYIVGLITGVLEPV